MKLKKGKKEENLISKIIKLDKHRKAKKPKKPEKEEQEYKSPEKDTFSLSAIVNSEIAVPFEITEMDSDGNIHTYVLSDLNIKVYDKGDLKYETNLSNIVESEESDDYQSANETHSRVIKKLKAKQSNDVYKSQDPTAIRYDYGAKGGLRNQEFTKEANNIINMSRQMSQMSGAKSSQKVKKQSYAAPSHAKRPHLRDEDQARRYIDFMQQLPGRSYMRREAGPKKRHHVINIKYSNLSIVKPSASRKNIITMQYKKLEKITGNSDLDAA